MKFKLSLLLLIVGFVYTDRASARQISNTQYSNRVNNNYHLWLKYNILQNKVYLKKARAGIQQVNFHTNSSILNSAADELKRGLTGLLDVKGGVKFTLKITAPSIIIGTPHNNPIIKNKFNNQLRLLPKDGYIIRTITVNHQPCIGVAANNDLGVLYGVFGLLRHLQTQLPLQNISIKTSPKIQWRTVDHWDNADRTVERGYAGLSLWKWDELPNKIDSRYKDYARANASVGINTVVLNNVNCNPIFITSEYLKKVASLANIFRPYGIRVMLSANFASPVTIGKLNTADPLEPAVRAWWKNKANEIYTLIPDFGGFLVKANAEGQPGPKDYGRTHVDGANMMGEALARYNGVVMWRAFVYGFHESDRARQAYTEFKELNGRFADNVFLQIKNGPLDFQPREPFSPLFGAMPNTAQMMEFQVTQEYLGFSTHLVYLAPLFKEALNSDTYAKGKGSTVARVLDGSLQEQKITGMAGVANTGSDLNWTGHPIAQANWYALGRLAWDHTLTSEQIADEWIKMTFGNNPYVVKTLSNIMMISREALVSYETPLGLHVLCDGDHYNPRPGNRTYYHHADTVGLGFDRTMTGSRGVEQYNEPLRSQLNNIQTCPEELLTWFHHVPWEYRMKSGRTFWDELCHKYYNGVNQVRQMQKNWAGMANYIDKATFDKVTRLLVKQEDDAVWWRDCCLWYFAKYSRRPIPANYEQPRYPDGKRLTK